MAEQNGPAVTNRVTLDDYEALPRPNRAVPVVRPHTPLAERDPLPPESDRVETPTSAGLGQLYREHSTRLRRYFMVRSSRVDADDLVQETFARLAGVTARTAVAIDQPRAYVNRIANNLITEQARFAARRSAALHVSDDDVQLTGVDPVALLESRDRLQRLERAMAAMKPATREIFMAHRLDGDTYRDIAARTGRSIKGIEKQMGKALYIINRAMRNG
ncbi:RNA polymerase sigma factor (plasmid) [Sphingomonas paeninsulae]|uniref:RNA polymerase sigma factor n=1 Tax=Sphingomonas paeninsulae TaxID=2319844 RepID=A0A494TC76_SPHPE|nr:RNA polymerase sigma factor [Sphingomonas paeninsulae]AYJ84844.1 RNA polymerase sigma factor [Sphingomonas paeninsulae]